MRELFIEYDSLKMRIKITQKPVKGKITPEMIETARQYPIENLIEVKKRKALCPFHDDQHPSMGIKNNYYRCFACGASGDVINFVMQRDGMTFPETIKYLT
jgi:DNA primase